MRLIHFIFSSFILALTLALGACSGEQPVEKAIIGTWVQETPISMTSRGLQTTTSDTIMRLKKNGEIHLTRNLDVAAQNLPPDGVKVSIELRGRWEIINGQLIQTQDTALVMPRTSDETTGKWAEEFQAQANQTPPTIKEIIAVDKKQFILQDVDTGTTDVYVRK